MTVRAAHRSWLSAQTRTDLLLGSVCLLVPSGSYTAMAASQTARLLFDSALAVDPSAALRAKASTNQPSYENPGKTSKSSSLCLSLLPLFNFGGSSVVTYDEWQRGARSLGLAHLADDQSVWTEMTELYGDGASHADNRHASVDLERVAYLVPLEPHVQSLMRAIVFAIDHVKDFAATQIRKQTKQTEMKTSGACARARASDNARGRRERPLPRASSSFASARAYVLTMHPLPSQGSSSANVARSSCPRWRRGGASPTARGSTAGAPPRCSAGYSCGRPAAPSTAGRRRHTRGGAPCALAAA